MDGRKVRLADSHSPKMPPVGRMVGLVKLQRIALPRGERPLWVETGNRSTSALSSGLFRGGQGLFRERGRDEADANPF